MQQAAVVLKHVSQTLVNGSDKLTPAILSSARKQDATARELPMQVQLIATMWVQLTDIYGARFVNQYGERDSGVWYQALRDLREEDILFGLDAMLRDPRFETWPPNCTQLRHLCIKKPGLKSVPSVGRAFDEARHNLRFASPRKWSHPAVKCAVKRVGLADMCDAHTFEAFTKFSVCYEQVLARIATGKPLPEIKDEELVIPSVRKNPVPRLSLEIKNNPLKTDICR